MYLALLKKHQNSKANKSMSKRPTHRKGLDTLLLGNKKGKRKANASEDSFIKEDYEPTDSDSDSI